MKKLKRIIGILILLGVFGSGLFFVYAGFYFMAIGISIAIVALIIFAIHLMTSE